MSQDLDYTGRVVLVTGGHRGVGRGISECFLEAGARVVVCGRNQPEELPSAGGREARFEQADVRDAEQAGALVRGIAEREGRLDVVVNNAGGSPPTEAAAASPRFSEKIVQLNLLAPLHVAQAANAIMQEQDDGGSIVNISSVSGVRPSPGTAAYGAAKAGLLNLTESLAIEWGPRVRVNAIITGLVRTEQAHLHYGDEEGIAAVARTIPRGRMAVPGDIGRACLFLASPMADYVSGASLAVHGGGERPAYLQAAKGDE